MRGKIYHSNSEDATIKIAQEFVQTLSNGNIVCLHGVLGAGKSVFARACIRALCGDPALIVPSPTFTLVQMYETSNFPLWHFDLYRLENPQEIYEIGWEEALSDGVLFIEWAEKLGDLRPSSVLNIQFAIENDRRTLSIS